jgi:preprotein translocase subunit SecD
MQVKLIVTLFLLLSCQLQDKRLSKSESKQESINCVLKTGWYLVDFSRKGCERKMANDTSSYYLLPAPLLTSVNVTAVDDMKFMDETRGFLISFDAAGTKQWEKVTGNHVGDFFAFVLNDTLLTMGANTAKISTGKAFFPLYNRSNVELQRIKEAIMAK